MCSAGAAAPDAVDAPSCEGRVMAELVSRDSVDVGVPVQLAESEDGTEFPPRHRLVSL